MYGTWLIEGRPNKSAVAGCTDVTKPCQKDDEMNSCFQEPLSLTLFKIDVIVFKRPPDRQQKAANNLQMEAHVQACNIKFTPPINEVFRKSLSTLPLLSKIIFHSNKGRNNFPF